MRVTFVFFAALLLAAACSTSSSSSSGGSSGSPGDGGAKDGATGGDGGTSGGNDTCTPGGGHCACVTGCSGGITAPASMRCPQPPPGSGACGQECCLPAPDAGSFACGSVTCNGGEFCSIVSGGAQQPDGGGREVDSCEPMPAQCLNNRTCACVKANARQCSDACDDDGAGHITLRCNVP